MTAKEAAHKTMDEVGGALLAIALVLCAVFIPTAFISGLQGTFYQQFAVTIAASTAISCFVSLTLSPAMAALLLKPHGHDEGQKQGFLYTLGAPVRAFFRYFNAGFDWLSRNYGALTSRLIRFAVILLVAYAGLIALTVNRLSVTPTGLVPQLDRGYFIVAFQLPPGSSLPRTDAVIRKATDVALSRPGIAHAVAFAGLDGATFTIAPNTGVIFVTLASFDERKKLKLTSDGIFADLRQQMFAINEAFALVIPPRPCRASAPAAASRAMSRTARAAGCPRSRARPGSSPARRRRCRASSSPSPCSRPRRRRSSPISTGPRRRCWACRSPASSRRSRSSWVRPISTTSTCSGGPTG